MKELTDTQKADVLESLEYIKDVGPGPSIMERFADGDGIKWSIDGDDACGMFYHLNRVFEIFEIKSAWETYQEKVGNLADEVKTKKEKEWTQ